jgi:hypothetical protein
LLKYLNQNAYWSKKVLTMHRKIPWESSWDEIESVLLDIIRTSNEQPLNAILLDFLATCGAPLKRPLRLEALMLFRTLNSYPDAELVSAIKLARNFDSSRFGVKRRVINIKGPAELTDFLNKITFGTIRDALDNEFYYGAMYIGFSQDGTLSEYTSDIATMEALEHYREHCLTPIDLDSLNRRDQLTYQRKLSLLQEMLIGMGPRVPYYKNTLEQFLSMAQNSTYSKTQREKILYTLDGLIQGGIAMHPSLLGEEWFSSLLYGYASLSEIPPGSADMLMTEKYGIHVCPNDLIEPLIERYHRKPEFHQHLLRWSKDKHSVSYFINCNEVLSNHVELARDFIFPGLMERYNDYRGGKLELNSFDEELPGNILWLLSYMPSSEYSQEWFKSIVSQIVLRDRNKQNAQYDIGFSQLLSRMPASCFSEEPYNTIGGEMIERLLMRKASEKDCEYLQAFCLRRDSEAIFAEMPLDKSEMISKFPERIQREYQTKACRQLVLSDDPDSLRIVRDTIQEQANQRAAKQRSMRAEIKGGQGDEPPPKGMNP